MTTEIEKACIELDITINDYLDDYEYDDGELCCHSPTETEDTLIRDAVAGLMTDDSFVRRFVDWRLLVETGKRLDSVKHALTKADALARTVMLDQTGAA